MTIEQFGATLLKRWKFILVCFVIVGLGARIGTRFVTPMYLSAVLVQVAINSSNSDINNLLASNQLVQTETVIATSDPVLREVASHYKGMAVSQLEREVSASVRTNTQIFEIDVLDANPGRAAALANDVAATLIQQQEQGSQQETAQAGFLIVVQNAQASQSPVQPNTTLNTGAGLLAGLFLGMLLATVFEQFDTRIRTLEDLTKLLSWPILATLRRAKPEEVLDFSSQNLTAQSYQTLRTNIGLSVIDRPLRSLLITSAMSSEGKSVIAANLAVSMANAGKNTLLIDADLHHPIQHIQFGLPPTLAGLSDAIVAMNTATQANSFSHQELAVKFPLALQSNTPVPPTFSLEPFMYQVGIPNLRVMPAGSLPPNPAELLASKAMQCLLLSIEMSGAEVVIFDAPTLLGLTDTSILAAMVGAILFVVDITRANKKSLKQARELITKTDIRVLGCIVNKQRQGRRNTPYTYYYHRQKPDNEMNHGAQNGHRSPAPSMPLVPMSPLERKSGPN